MAERKIKQKKRKRGAQMLGFSLILAIVSVAFYAFFLQEIKNTTLEYADLLNEIVYESERQQRLDQVGSLLQDISKEEDGLGHFFLADEDVLGFVETIENLAAENSVNLDIGRLEIVDRKESAGRVLSLNATIGGEWSDVVDLLALAEQAPYATDIEKVAISSENITVEDPEENTEQTTVSAWRGTLEMIVLMESED